jgi:hypothetical protein
MPRPFAPSLRAYPDPEGPFLTYAEVRRSLHPAPAEQHVVIPRRVEILDPQGDKFLAEQLRLDAIWGLL